MLAIWVRRVNTSSLQVLHLFLGSAHLLACIVDVCPVMVEALVQLPVLSIESKPLVADHFAEPF
jgi:hypothetical protein